MLIVSAMVNNAKLKGKRHNFYLPPHPPQVKYIDFHFMINITNIFSQNLVCTFKDEEETKKGHSKVKIVWEPPKGTFWK